MKKRVGTVYVAAFSGACIFHALTGWIIPGQRLTEASAQETVIVGENRSGRANDAQIDAWIRDARKVMAQQGIPGSHAGIKRNLIRESGGDPTVCNDWDINAKNGTPSCGLLQVIQPTFDRWKLPQSAYDNAGVRANANKLTDPVANIVTACNYAYHRYGSMDNVNGPY